ncbi:hypothetical protein E8M01_19215 [Phreatobacter stygius]|uniref:Uncharacterized protein n=2 Tax=Phreatobacter stygius TaxID=1940610 RepID=A0A4D7B0B6_9HYPH|nr:hypothetical protein E8M01_19215 [Phreatobacter stygius]
MPTPERLRAANIHPETKLATDYLNHFNEAIMLLELIPSMPDCMDDVIGWTPLTYEQHFLQSSYRDKELVLQVYQHAPAAVLRRFHAVIDQMDQLMTAAIDSLKAVGAGPAAAIIAEEAGFILKPLAARAVGVMNAVVDEDEDQMAPASAQDAIDALMTR